MKIVKQGNCGCLKDHYYYRGFNELVNRVCMQIKLLIYFLDLMLFYPNNGHPTSSNINVMFHHYLELVTESS